MVTRTEQRLAGLSALVTAGLLVLALVLFAGGPPTDHGGLIGTWFAEHATTAKASVLAWLAATVALVVFSVAVREAVWATIVDRGWAALLFVLGSVGFAAVSVVAAAVVWTLADQGVAGTLTPAVTITVWGVARTLLRFATWGLAVPVLVVGLVLYRYSLVGQFAAVTGVLLAVALIVPITWAPALYATAAWLAITGVAFLQPRRVSRRAEHPELVR